MSKWNFFLVFEKCVILLLLLQIFAIVVFGCISAGGYDDDNGICLFNGKAGACHYAVGIGVVAFLGCIAFLAIDLQFDTIDNPDTKKYITLADLGFSALWCFLWFIGFCYLADMWRRANTDSYLTYEVNNCQAAIAFSFFSIITWVSLLLYSVYLCLFLILFLG